MRLHSEYMWHADDYPDSIGSRFQQLNTNILETFQETKHKFSIACSIAATFE